MGNLPLSLGAAVIPSGPTHFRVWAPLCSRVDVQLGSPREEEYLPLKKESGGFFSGTGAAPPGALYRYRLDGGECFPDPCSRFQPQGPHGPSEVVDPAFAWRDEAWPGIKRQGLVLYELHVGTFTPEGSFLGVIGQLPYLKDLGVTAITLMPVATFPGRFNWGYDGVALYAPCATYGTPQQLRRLVDEAHAQGLGVILDVVYNHIGPSGNYLSRFSPFYFSNDHPREWGDPINFDGEHSGPVRDFFVQNARYWIDEFHFDGLRLDATQSLHDRSKKHIIREVVEAARAAAAGRSIVVVAENEPQDRIVLTDPQDGGCGADAMWVDDFHHSAKVAVTGRPEAYLSDYKGTAQELVSCALRNALFQGQWCGWQNRPRGTVVSDLPPEQFVFFLENHDQIANQLICARLREHAGEPRTRALTALLLLGPQTPLIFMGQEFFARSPFFYFADHEPELAAKVLEGRRAFLSQFSGIKHALECESAQLSIGEDAFQRSRLDLSERQLHSPALTLHRDLLRLRRDDPLFAGVDRAGIQGATLSRQALALRFIGSGDAGDRLLIVNLGSELRVGTATEPLLAPLAHSRWAPLFSSDAAKYGGTGALIPLGAPFWSLPGQSAFVLRSEGIP